MSTDNHNQNPGSNHPTYDGIEEHDNVLPNWWLATLFGAIVFAFGYWFFYHTMHYAELPSEETARIDKEREAARLKALADAKPASDTEIEAMIKDPAMLAEGKTTFTTICVACHGAEGQGIAGPNLTDAYWIHGHTPTDIAKAVAAGFPELGMPPWEPVIGPQKVRSVAAYVMTLKNTNVAGGKAPQGELVKE